MSAVTTGYRVAVRDTSQTPMFSWPKAKAISVVAMWLQHRKGVTAARLPTYQVFEK
jgi:hypothetical protein